MLILVYRIAEGGIQYALFFSHESKAKQFIEKELKPIYPNLETKLYEIENDMIDPTSPTNDLILW